MGAAVSKLDEQTASRSRGGIPFQCCDFNFAGPEPEESIVSKLDEQVDPRPRNGISFSGPSAQAHSWSLSPCCPAKGGPGGEVNGADEER
jgi:hypothetical protein